MLYDTQCIAEGMYPPGSLERDCHNNQREALGERETHKALHCGYCAEMPAHQEERRGGREGEGREGGREGEREEREEGKE